jgi:hypothetical protein
MATSGWMCPPYMDTPAPQHARPNRASCFGERGGILWYLLYFYAAVCGNQFHIGVSPHLTQKWNAQPLALPFPFEK